jgi:hypothetical protein
VRHSHGTIDVLILRKIQRLAAQFNAPVADVIDGSGVPVLRLEVLIEAVPRDADPSFGMALRLLSGRFFYPGDSLNRALKPDCPAAMH